MLKLHHLHSHLFLLSGDNTGEQIPSSSSMRDTEWATQNCTLAFHTVGKFITCKEPGYNTNVKLYFGVFYGLYVIVKIFSET